MEPQFDVFRQRLLEAIGTESLYTWAARIGINKGSLNGVMTRRTLPKVDMLAQMANALGCSIDWLIGMDISVQQVAQAKQKAHIFQGDAIVQAVKLVEMQVNENKNIDLDTKSTLISLMFGAINTGMADDEWQPYLGRLMQLCKHTALPDEELYLLETFRSASNAQKAVMTAHFKEQKLLVKLA